MRGNPPATYMAMVDTGANVSVISADVARAMMVATLDMQPVLLPGGRTSFDPVHDVSICLGGHESGGRWHRLLVTSTTLATEGIDVLIGMDLLLQAKFGWDGPGGSGWISD